MTDRALVRDSVVVALLMVALALIAMARRPVPPLPTIDREQVTPWMAEALPGIGPHTAATVAAQMRAGHLPTHRAAASAAAVWFHGWPGSAPGSAPRSATAASAVEPITKDDDPH